MWKFTVLARKISKLGYQTTAHPEPVEGNLTMDGALVFIHPTEMDKENRMDVISIMPDFGMGPFAWIARGDDGTGRVGANIADAVAGFAGCDFTVSEELTEQFKAWAIEFEASFDDYKDFNWNDFHTRGLKMTQQLANEVGPIYRYFYHRPHEDEFSDWPDRQEVFPEGRE